MTNKLINFLSKYHLGGLVDKVIWSKNSDDELEVWFKTDSVMGIVSSNDSELNDSFDGEVPMFDTAQLIKLISMLSNQCSVSIERKNKTNKDVATAITFKDATNCTVKAVLADPSVFGDQLNKKRKDFPIEILRINLEQSLLDRIVKAKSILDSNPNIVLFPSGNDSVKIVFGYSENNVDEIKFDIVAEEVSDDMPPVAFNGNILKSIQSVSKDCSSVVMTVHPIGIGKAAVIIKTVSDVARCEYIMFAKTTLSDLS